ncbi:MAG: response regulator transcription factor [Deltaproteobacteria bacterium]|nr:response regulator transcription factor [Deltaproteobacteria bacterium]
MVQQRLTFPSAFLVLEDELVVGDALAAHLARYGEIIRCETVQHAMCEIAGGKPLLAACLDIVLPDGNGLHVLEALRHRYTRLPTMVFTGTLPVEPLIRRTQNFGALFVSKPARAQQLDLLVDAALSQCGRASRSLVASVRCLMAAKQLSPRQTLCLELAAVGLRAPEIGERLGVRPQTVRNHFDAIRRRADACSFDAVLADVRRRCETDSC